MTKTYLNFHQAQQQLANIEAIDYFFAKEMLAALVENEQTSTTQLLLHIFIALSANLRAGHTCLSLAQISNLHWASAEDEQGVNSHQGFIFPNKESLINELTAVNIGVNDAQPLVFSNNNLYMRRYYQFETELAHGIKTRLTSQSSKVALTTVSAIVEQLFPAQTPLENNEIDWQKIALANAVNKNFLQCLVKL